MSLKLECLSHLKVAKMGISLKLECHSNWNVTKIVMSLKTQPLHFISDWSGFSFLYQTTYWFFIIVCSFIHFFFFFLFPWYITSWLFFFFFTSYNYLLGARKGKALARRHFLGAMICFQRARRRSQHRSLSQL